MGKNSLKSLHLAAQTIYDKKGVNILALDVREESTLTDYLLIAEGNVDRHLIAIGKELISALESSEGKPAHVEGLKSGDWIVLDYIDFIVHLFTPGLREKYDLDALWGRDNVVSLDIKVEEGV